MKAGARASPLSRAQFMEVEKALLGSCILEPIWVETMGDKDRATSLRHLGKTDFFTRELDQMLLSGLIQVAIHSAKDLPEPLPQGLEIVAMTRSIDSRDALVMRENETLASLPPFARIATSSERREEAVKRLRTDLCFIDLRGTIEERLAKLELHEADGVVVAEAALIRLGLAQRNRIFLPGETALDQGRLAIVARQGDEAAQAVFSRLDTRKP